MRLVIDEESEAKKEFMDRVGFTEILRFGEPRDGSQWLMFQGNIVLQKRDIEECTLEELKGLILHKMSMTLEVVRQLVKNKMKEIAS